MTDEHQICDCPLCLAIDKEPSIYEDDRIKILETKNLKGHKRRIMVIWRKHNDYMIQYEDIDYMMNQLEKVGKDVFNYTHKFVIMSTKFGTVRDHWHYVATDLEPKAEDFQQILGTPWVRVVHVMDWKGLQEAKG